MSDKTTKAINALPEGSFSRQFLSRVKSIDERALNAGSSLTEVCRRAGISRMTPDRWREKVPKTVALIDVMEAKVREIEGEAPVEPKTERCECGRELPVSRKEMLAGRR